MKFLELGKNNNSLQLQAAIDIKANTTGFAFTPVRLFFFNLTQGDLVGLKGSREMTSYLQAPRRTTIIK